MDRTADTVSPNKDDKTILIVDDEELMLRLLEMVFSRHGYHVMVATDGDQALETYRSHKHQIDAVLLDVRLPRMTGEEVFRRMIAENAAVKVVMASGFLEPELKTEMALAGVKHFVTKPYELDELIEIFRSIVDDQ